jgi:hypothetical protein
MLNGTSLRPTIYNSMDTLPALLAIQARCQKRAVTKQKYRIRKRGVQKHKRSRYRRTKEEEWGSKLKPPKPQHEEKMAQQTIENHKLKYKAADTLVPQRSLVSLEGRYTVNASHARMKEIWTYITSDYGTRDNGMKCAGLSHVVTRSRSDGDIL